jgi:hypothetical protein
MINTLDKTPGLHQPCKNFSITGNNFAGSSTCGLWPDFSKIINCACGQYSSKEQL